MLGCCFVTSPVGVGGPALLSPRVEVGCSARGLRRDLSCAVLCRPTQRGYCFRGFSEKLAVTQQGHGATDAASVCQRRGGEEGMAHQRSAAAGLRGAQGDPGGSCLGQAELPFPIGLPFAQSPETVFQHWLDTDLAESSLGPCLPAHDEPPRRTGTLPKDMTLQARVPKQWASIHPRLSACPRVCVIVCVVCTCDGDGVYV